MYTDLLCHNCMVLAELNFFFQCSIWYYLENSYSNAEQQCDEEEEDEGERCASHVIFLCIHAIVPLVGRLHQEV